MPSRTDRPKVEEYFERAGVEPHRVVDQDPAPDVRGTTLAVLRYLGLDSAPELVLPAPARRPQADAVTEEWAARFAAATGRS